MKDEKVHIRKRWNSPDEEPAYCGSTSGWGTVTEAWGWWGSAETNGGEEGGGYEWICKECEQLKAKAKAKAK